MNTKSFTNLCKTAGAVAVLAASTGLMAQAGAAESSAPRNVSPPELNPFSPAYAHPYRHGAVPTRDTKGRMDAWRREHAVERASAAAPTASSGILSYGGGVSGVGVLSGQSKVYLVVYGNQWGTQGTDANGNLTFTGDSAGAAVATQKMFKGIGTNSELWSAELTQWCDGTGVASGATTCPSGASFIPYQQNIFAGIWYDNSIASPASATGKQLAQEAINAAAHFGNTTTASNRYAYYVIMSPHGTNPDNYQSPTTGYCAWHDYTGDTTLSGGAITSPYGNLAFSNQPYNVDQGAGCGVGFVNTPGTLDGYTMTLGHEWQEMMSDQFPAGGWTNHTGGTYNGQENSDECAWIAAGTTGGAANIAFSTGTFAEQASWSNDTANCAISHAILSHGGSPVANFSYVTSGLTANFTDSSTDAGGTISSRAWTFGDGGTSTATNPSYTYAAAGTYSVSEKVTDNLGATNTKTSSVTVSSGGSSQLLGNTGFETGTAAPWTTSAGVVSNSTSEPTHAGSWDAWMNGYGSAHTDTVSQQVAIPAGKTSATLSFYLHIDTAETTTTSAYDTIKVQVYNTAGTLLGTLATYSNLNKVTGYAVHNLSMNAYIGQTVVVKFTGTEDASLQTSFVLDDATLTVQ